MKNYILPLAMILLSGSIFYAGFQLRGVVVNLDDQEKPNQVETKEEPIEKGLLTLEETAAYLRISAEDLDRLTRQHTIERSKRRSFPTYEYLPFISINGEKYFQKEIVDQWIDYNVRRWYHINVDY